MHYYVIGTSAGDGLCAADVLGGTLALLIAAPEEHPSWGVYATESPLAGPLTTEVGTALCAVIDAARAYPPALALARDDVDGCPALTTVADSLGRWERALSDRLAAGRPADHVLRTALVDFGGDLSRGRRYWVLDPRPLTDVETVRWVSDDYWIYSAAATCFDWSDGNLGSSA